MDRILEDAKATIILIFIAVISIITLGAIGTAFGGQAEIISNQGMNAIVYLVLFVLALPPLGLFVWLISVIIKLVGENSNQSTFY